jgi:hypothetical protein
VNVPDCPETGSRALRYLAVESVRSDALGARPDELRDAHCRQVGPGARQVHGEPLASVQHVVPVPQTLPHFPQFEVSARNLHTPLQTCSQAHVAFVHCQEPAPQDLPHALQLPGSVVVSTQPPAQHVFVPWHAEAPLHPHAPAVVHALPFEHAPQLATFRGVPQLSFPDAAPQVRLTRPQNAASDSGAQHVTPLPT